MHALCHVHENIISRIFYAHFAFRKNNSSLTSQTHQ